MDEDYSIVENELTHQLSDLKRNLHMKKVKTLGRKLHELKKIALQRKLIRNMTGQVEELEPTVSKIYSPQNAVRDNQIKGYLIYLLQLKDFYSREVETKKEIIQQRENQIKKLAVKLCTMRNEYAKKKRSMRSKASEFTQLENMSNKTIQLEQRVCSLKNEIKGQRRNIMDMRVFLKQYKKFENKFRSQVTRMTEDVQLHLDRAVATYEEREEFVHKAKIYKERCAQDLRKAALNENALQLVLDKSEKLEDFETLQNQARYDSRISATGDLIDQGITGLEPDMERSQILYSTIVQSSGKEGPELIQDHFKLTDEKTKSKLSYLEQLFKEIHHTQDAIDRLKTDNRTLHKSLVNRERKLKWLIEEEQKKAEESRLQATSSDEKAQEGEEQLHILLEKVQSLHQRCFPKEEETKDAEEPEDAAGSDAGTAKKDAAGERINDRNAIDFTERIEKKILELLMVIEYLWVEELSEEDLSTTTIIGEEQVEELLEMDEPPKVAYLDTVHPRVLKSESDIDTVSDLDEERAFLNLDELKEIAVSAVAEIEKEISSEGED